MHHLQCEDDDPGHSIKSNKWYWRVTYCLLILILLFQFTFFIGFIVIYTSPTVQELIRDATELKDLIINLVPQIKMLQTQLNQLPPQT